MTDFDLDRLGDVWRGQPDPAEMAALQRTAETVTRRARRSQVVDAAMAVLVSGIVLVLALSNPRLETLLIGAAAIALMLGSSIRQRKLRALELTGLTGTAEQMLDQSVARVQATLKRTRIGMLGALPGIVLGLAFGAAIERGANDGILIRILEKLSASGAMVVPLAVLFAGLYLYLFTASRRARHELARLNALREAYRREQRPISPE